MDVGVLLYLLSLGFAVGLSGAVIPGPLMVYTIEKSLEKGKWTGAKVIAGHAAVEVLIFMLLTVGLLEFVSDPQFFKAVSILGGTAMILMGASSLRGLKDSKPEKVKDMGHGLFLGGIIFTALNPSIPLWWFLVGAGLLAKGYEAMALAGTVLVLAGHWVADFGWYLLLSLTASKSSGTLYEKGWYKTVRVTLALLLLGIGVYFLASGL